MYVLRFYKISGDIGAIYPLAIQTVLPRMLAAAAPPGSSSLENQRQCLKVIIIVCLCIWIYSSCYFSAFSAMDIDLMFNLIC